MEGNPFKFVVICPNGHEAMQERLDRLEIERRVVANARIPLYCAKCDGWWNAPTTLVESLRRSLDER